MRILFFNKIKYLIHYIYDHKLYAIIYEKLLSLGVALHRVHRKSKGKCGNRRDVKYSASFPCFLPKNYLFGGNSHFLAIFHTFFHILSFPSWKLFSFTIIHKTPSSIASNTVTRNPPICTSKLKKIMLYKSKRRANHLKNEHYHTRPYPRKAKHPETMRMCSG